MGKKGRNQKKDNRSHNKRRSGNEYVDPEDLEDEIDAFHKQRDIVPLDISGNGAESSEDDEELVFDDKDIDYDDEDDDDDDPQDTGFAAKIARQQKFLRTKFGGFNDEMNEEEENEEETKKGWGGNKAIYHGGDNKDFEYLSSDNEDAMQEEEEVLRLQRERTKNLTKEDFGLEDDESDRELTLEEISVKGERSVKPLTSKEALTDTASTFEEVEKDLNALSKEEQMNVVYSSAPELIGLLSELNDAVEELESRVNPLICKAKVGGVILGCGMQYLEVKQLLLLSYCQAITFYLLLKSEGHPVRDHPVIARLVEIKSLLDKVKELDENLPSDFEDYLKKKHLAEVVKNTVTENDAFVLSSDSIAKAPGSSIVLADTVDLAKPRSANQLEKIESLRVSKEEKSKRKNDQVAVQSLEMLKVRAGLEEKLKQKGAFSTFPSKTVKVQKHAKPVNGKLETYNDFDDDAIDFKRGNCGLTDGLTSSLGSSKLSQLVIAKRNTPKVISGDDDLPKRDDIGERRRKHELRVLATAGIKSEDDDDGEELGSLGPDGGHDVEEDDDTGDSEDDELYKQIKEERDAKLAAKSAIYTWTASTPSLPENVDGKRQISSQIDKNRGLTRPRKKIYKNPRKKNRMKHEKAVKRRKGQVREFRQHNPSYGGETSGINARISRSIRF